MENDDENENGQQSPLAIIAGLGSSYTTPEAHKIAKQIYESYRDSEEMSIDEEDAASAEAAAAARRAQDVLRAARQRILTQRQGSTQQLLAFAAGMGKPTKSGAFSESLGYGAEALNKSLDERRKVEEGQDKDVAAYDLDINKIDQQLAAARASVLANRRSQGFKGAMEALKVLAKEIRPAGSKGSSGMSPFGKVARDEGLIEGTPEFTARVTELYNADMAQRRGAAGLDVDKPDLDRERQLADELGIPRQLKDPFESYSTKQKQTALEARQKEGQAQLKEIGDATGAARQAIQDMNRFMFLNKGVATGPIVGRFWPDTLLSDAGQEMRSITARQSRLMRVPGEGPMSNYDARQLTQAAVSVTKDESVNANIAKGVKSIKNLQLDYNRFMNDFFAARGHLVGAQQAWQQYVDDNPIFDPKAKEGSFQINKGRQTYRDYFRAKNTENDPVMEGLTPEQRAGAMRPAQADGGQVYADGGSVKKKETGLKRLLRNLEQGATFNFGDELNAAMARGPYADAVADERRSLEQSSSDHPTASTTAQVAGAVPTGTAMAYLGARGLGRLKGRGKIGKLAALIPRSTLGRMAVAGAGAGALAGYGSSQDEDPLGEIGSGALIGAVTGPLAGFATKYGVRGVQRIWDFATGKAMSAADRKIVEAAIRDDVNLKDVVNQVIKDNKAGIPSTMADAGGRNMQGLAESIAKRGGAGPDAMLDQLEGRQAGAYERVTDHINNALAPDDYFGQLEKLKEQLYTQAKPLYAQAYAENPAVKTDVLTLLHQTDSGQKAIDRAIEAAKVTAALEGRPVEQVVGKYDPVKKMVTQPSLEFLDHVKRALDGMINTEEMQGATDIGHGLRALRSRLMTELKDPSKVSDTYQAARQQYAGDLEVLQALEMGRDQFTKLSPSELTQAMQNMSFAEKDALRTGVAESLFTRVGQTAEASNPATRIIGTPGMVNKLAQLFDTDAAFKKFQGALTKEAGMFDRGKRVISAGRRARVEAGDEAPSSARDLLVSGGLSAMVPGADVVAQPGVWARAGNLASRALNPMRQETIDEIAHKMSATDALTLDEPAGALQKELERLSRQLGQAHRAAMRGAVVGSGSVGPDPYGYIDTDAEEENGDEAGGFASGGMVGGLADLLSGVPGGIDQVPQIRLSDPVPSTPYTSSLAGITAGLPTAGGRQYGTDTARTRANPVIDYEHYGETGPEATFFNNNAPPDPRFIAKDLPYATANGANSNSASKAGGLSSLISAATTIPKLVSGAKSLGSLLGIGGAGAGAGAAGIGTGLVDIAAPDLIAASAPGAAAASETLAGLGGEAAGVGAGAAGSSGLGLLGSAGVVAAPLALYTLLKSIFPHQPVMGNLTKKLLKDKFNINPPGG